MEAVVVTNSSFHDLNVIFHTLTNIYQFATHLGVFRGFVLVKQSWYKSQKDWTKTAVCLTSDDTIHARFSLELEGVIFDERYNIII